MSTLPAHFIPAPCCLLITLVLALATQGQGLGLLHAADEQALEALEETLPTPPAAEQAELGEATSDAAEPPAEAQPQLLATDTASNPAYAEGWAAGANGGFGFLPWELIAHTGPNDSQAGFYVRAPQETEALSAAISLPAANGDGTPETLAPGRTWGLYARGIGYEQALALRPLKSPLQEGDTFSFRLRQTRFELSQLVDDATSGEVGLALQSGGHPGGLAVDGWDARALWKFAVREGGDGYEMHTADGWQPTGVPLSATDVLVTFKLLSPATAEVTVRALASALSGEGDGDEAQPGQLVLDYVPLAIPPPLETEGEATNAPGPIATHVLLFNRDGEQGDVFFTDLRQQRPLP